jgi:hypothetical protein
MTTTVQPIVSHSQLQPPTIPLSVDPGTLQNSPKPPLLLDLTKLPKGDRNTIRVLSSDDIALPQVHSPKLPTIDLKKLRKVSNDTQIQGSSRDVSNRLGSTLQVPEIPSSTPHSRSELRKSLSLSCESARSPSGNSVTLPGSMVEIPDPQHSTSSTPHSTNISAPSSRRESVLSPSAISTPELISPLSDSTSTSSASSSTHTTPSMSPSVSPHNADVPRVEASNRTDLSEQPPVDPPLSPRGDVNARIQARVNKMFQNIPKEFAPDTTDLTQSWRNVTSQVTQNGTHEAARSEAARDEIARNEADLSARLAPLTLILLALGIVIIVITLIIIKFR